MKKDKIEITVLRTPGGSRVCCLETDGVTEMCHFFVDSHPRPTCEISGNYATPKHSTMPGCFYCDPCPIECYGKKGQNPKSWKFVFNPYAHENGGVENRHYADRLGPWKSGNSIIDVIGFVKKTGYNFFVFNSRIFNVAGEDTGVHVDEVK